MVYHSVYMDIDIDILRYQIDIGNRSKLALIGNLYFTPYS